MASNTLTANSIGSTYVQILHIGTGTAGACTVRTGDGTATVLDFVSGGAKINGTFEVTGNVTIGGAITAKGVPVFRRVTSDVTASTTTQVNIAEFDFVPVSGAVYQVEMSLIATSAATTTGVQVVNSGGAGTLVLAEAGGILGISAIAGTYAATSAPSSSAAFGIRLFGIFTASSTATLQFDVKSEVASSAVVIKAGSILKITRIA